MDNMLRAEEFGKDLGVIYGAMKVGRKVGAGKDFWTKLSDDKALFGRVVDFVHSGGGADPIPSLGTGEAQLADWVRKYKNAGISIKAQDVIIPLYRKGLDRLIVVPKVMTSQRAFEICKKSFPCWKIDEQVSLTGLDQSPRNGADGAYAVWVCDSAASDDEHKAKSYNRLQSKHVNMITLCERLLLEWKYFDETKRHLDIKSWTITSSLRSLGGVFTVGFFDGEMRINHFTCDRGNHDPVAGSREVISRS